MRSAALAAALALASGLPSQVGAERLRLRSRPEVGRRVAVHVTEESALRPGESRVLRDGVEQPGRMQRLRASSDTAATLALVEETLAVDAGRVTRLRRTYAELARSGEVRLDVGGAVTRRALEQEGALEGADVLFEREAAEGAFAARFDGGSVEDSERDEALLDGLAPLCDLAGLLPVQEVEVGARWRLPPALLERLFEPYGDVGLREPGEEGEPADEAEEDGDEPEPEWTGAVRATLVARRGGADGELAEVALAVEAANARDLTERARERRARQRADLGGLLPLPEVVACRDGEEWSGAGTLLWDLERDMPRRLELSCEILTSRTQSTLVQVEGREVPEESTSAFVLTRRLVQRFEAEP